MILSETEQNFVSTLVGELDLSEQEVANLIDGLFNAKADRDKDGSVTVSELKAYVYSNVVQLTSGKQMPTSRRDNVLNDFPIIQK